VGVLHFGKAEKGYGRKRTVGREGHGVIKYVHLAVWTNIYIVIVTGKGQTIKGGSVLGRAQRTHGRTDLRNGGRYESNCECQRFRRGGKFSSGGEKKVRKEVRCGSFGGFWGPGKKGG